MKDAFVERNFTPASLAMIEKARFNDHGDRDAVLLYLGDHDPSGEDMVRDVRDRLATFGADVDVRKVALTMDQVDEFKPPPQPAKMTDSRAKAYVEKHGVRHSWEVDALDPADLQPIIERELDALLDRKLMDEQIRQENRDKWELLRATKSILAKRKRR